MDKTDKLAFGGLGAAVGGYAMYHAIQDSYRRVNRHFDSYVRSEINRTCGSTLGNGQMGQLIRTPAWRALRPELPYAGKWETFWDRLLGPCLMFLTGSSVAGLSLGMAASAIIEDLAAVPGLLALGFLAVVDYAGKVWFFTYMQKGFVQIDGLAYNSAVCTSARELSRQSEMQALRQIEMQPEMSSVTEMQNVDLFAAGTEYQYAQGIEAGAAQMMFVAPVRPMQFEALALAR